MEQDLYSRQMKWREDAKKKALDNKTLNDEDPECTFEPKKYTKHPQKKFTGSASAALDKGTSNHVVRQTKARQNKKESPSKLTGPKNSSLLPVEAVRESDTNRSHLEQRISPHPTPPGSPSTINGAPYGSVGMLPESVKMDVIDYNDESVIDLLERERREWQSDRVKLIHCIHLQQLELTQRAVASHEKATDIAKEFARAIEGFEERLVSVENNVHKEISAIKSIAETLLKSSDNRSQQKEESAVDKRVAALESCMEGILDRLDNIATSINSGNKLHGPSSHHT